MKTRDTTRAAVRLCTVAAAVVGLGACSSSPEPGATRPGGAASSSATHGGTLRVGAVGTGAAPTTDPHGALFAESDWVRLSALYDTLTTRGKAGSVAPGLAESWTPSQDASSWTFTLRKDAKFSDGTPVTAGDALFSIGRMVTKTADNGGRAGKIDMARSKATNDQTLVLVTSTPDAELPRSLSLGSFVVKKDTNDFAKPVGSGPFRLESSTDSAAVLIANPYWWGGRPGVDRVELRAFADPQAMGQAITGGSLDLALGVQPATAKAASASGAQLARRPGSETAPLLMRVDKAPFTDERVRKAVSMAVDRKALVDQVYLGYGDVGKDMIKLDEPGVPGDIPDIKRDVEGAKKLLAEAGHGGGLDVVLNTTSAYPAMAASATVVKQQLAEVGITVEVKSHAPDQYWTKVYGTEPFTVGYYGDAPFTTLVRAAMLSDSSYSETGWKDPAFDKTYAEAMRTTDDDARQRKLGELYRMLAGKSGRVVWGFGERLTLHRPGVQGVSADGGPWDLSRITVGG